MARHAPMFSIAVLSALSLSAAALGAQFKNPFPVTPERLNGPPIQGDVGVPVVVIAPTPDPQYPISGVAALYQSGAIHDEGSVVLRLDVDATGEVVEARVASSSGLPALDQAAVQLAKTPWRFAPGKIQGAPAPMSFQYRVEFKKPT